MTHFLLHPIFFLKIPNKILWVSALAYSVRECFWTKLSIPFSFDAITFLNCAVTPAITFLSCAVAICLSCGSSFCPHFSGIFGFPLHYQLFPHSLFFRQSQGFLFRLELLL